MLDRVVRTFVSRIALIIRITLLPVLAVATAYCYNFISEHEPFSWFPPTTTGTVLSLLWSTLDAGVIAVAVGLLALRFYGGNAAYAVLAGISLTLFTVSPWHSGIHDFAWTWVTWALNSYDPAILVILSFWFIAWRKGHRGVVANGSAGCAGLLR